MTKEPDVSAILPIHPFQRDRMDLFRAAALVQSMEKFGTMAALVKLCVVVPETGVAAAKSLQTAFRSGNQIEVVSENDLFSAEERKQMMPLGGWHRQQLIKLAAPRLIEEPRILTLDSDVLNLRPLDMAALAPKGGVPTQYGKQFDEWRIESAKLMKVKPPLTPMGVTPAFLGRDILLHLYKYLEADSGKSWIEALCDARAASVQWTEYMLYQSAGQRAKVWSRRHETAAQQILLGIWKKTTIDDNFFKDLAAKKPIFLVNQSVRADADGAHAELHAKGLPSLFDLGRDTLHAVAEAIHAAAKASSNAPRVAAFANGVERLLAPEIEAGTRWFNADFGAMTVPEGTPENLAKLVAALAEKNHERARDALVPLLAIDKLNNDLLNLAFDVLLANGNYIFATAEAIKRMRANLLPFETLQYLLVALAKASQPALVARLMHEGMRRHRTRASFHRFCADVLQRLGRPALALAAARRASRLDPGNQKYAALAAELQRKRESLSA